MRIIVWDGIEYDLKIKSPLSNVDEMMYLCMDCRENSETW